MTKAYLKIRERPFPFGGEKLVISGDAYYIKYNDNKIDAIDFAKDIIGRRRESGLKDKLNMTVKIG